MRGILNVIFNLVKSIHSLAIWCCLAGRSAQVAEPFQKSNENIPDKELVFGVLRVVQDSRTGACLSVLHDKSCDLPMVLQPSGY